MNKKRKTWWNNHRVDEDGVIEKKCSKCDEWKEENSDNFYLVNKSKPEKGYQGECKECSIKRSSIVQENNPERSKQAKHEHYLRKIDIWYDRQKIYNDAHAEQNALKELEWQRNNSDKVAKNNLYRRQHKIHDITKEQWIACKDYFKNDKGEWCCAYCSKPISQHIVKRLGKLIHMDFHKEHVDDEGSNGLENCIPSCQSCNSSKRQYKLGIWYSPENKRRGGKVFSQERFDKIVQWITIDYKKFI